MTTYSFSAVKGTTVAFNAASDILTFGGDANDFLYANNGSGGLVVTNGAGQSVTLTGMTLAQVTSTNFTFASASRVFAGDNTTAITSDDLDQLATGALDRVAANTADLETDNTIFGLGGGDYITVGDGNNFVYGGSGIVDTADGSDTITINGAGTSSGNNLIITNAGNDTVLFVDPTGAGKTATVYGGNGNDNVVTGVAVGNVLMYGGDGNDTLDASSSTGGITMYGGASMTDTLDDDDTIFTGLGNNLVLANAGNDIIQYDDFGTTIAQTIYGGLGNDSIFEDANGTGSTGSLYIFGNAGIDVIDLTGHFGAATVYGGNASQDTTDGTDTFTFGTGVATSQTLIYGNAGNDTFVSAAALADGEKATIYGGLGVDSISISGARDSNSTLVIYGNEGNDSIQIDDSALTEDATVTFGSFEATDRLAITMAGGNATTLVVTGLGESVSINNTAANGNYVFTNYTGNFTATNLVLSDGSALITNVNGNATSMTGTGFADQIIAGSKGDTLSGGAGNDILVGGDGADSIAGGDGTDTINGGEGNDSIDAGAGTADDGIADSSVNGGTGSDLIIGGAFEDSFNGGEGNDTLHGGGDADTLTGGTENDTFRFAVADLNAVADTNVDLITDAFNGNDTIDFSDLTVGNLRGTGVNYAEGDASAAQVLGANVGLYVVTNAVAGFTEANIYSALGGIADDMLAGDIIYALVSNGTDARLVRITEAANAGTLAAADDTLEYVARLQGVDLADLAGLSEGNFDDFI